jgi:uncharacterized protein YkwD
MLEVMAFLRRCLFACLPLALLLTGTGPAAAASVAAVPAVAATSSDMTVAQARAYLLDRINAARANNGVRGVALDTRVADIAQARSDDMATNHYFAHLSTSAWTAMFTSRGVSWSNLGEILAENDWPAVGDSADEAMRQWHNSSGHWSIVTDNAYNYAGVGVAQDGQSGMWIWTVEFVKEPTGANAVAPSVDFTGATVLPYNQAYRKVRVSWSGTPGSAAIRDYRLQYRINGHRWRTLLRATTRTQKARRVLVGKTIEFRVRARDVNFVKGDWALSGAILVE